MIFLILAVVGPTGVGKTKLSIALAHLYNGEIINADSMQIYEGLDIGTAKVTQEEMEGIAHHLLSIKKVWEEYTVYDYQKDARKKIAEIKAKGKVPIFVGGTGLYLKAALYDYKFSEEKIKKNYDALTNEELVEKIEAYHKDLQYDQKNRKRLVRILQKLENQEEFSNNKNDLLYPDTLFIGLTTNRDILYQKINERFLKMVDPLIEEIKPFYDAKLKTKPLMTGIGYKEFYSYFDGEKTLEEVILECQKNSRKYAKRQYTWFKNQMNVQWFSVDYEHFDKTIKEVEEYIDLQKKSNV